MPAYDYRCTECQAIEEVIHSMTAEPQLVCPVCQGKLERIITTFPHVAFDWKHYQSRDDNMRLSLHAARAGQSSPASQDAGQRV